MVTLKQLASYLRIMSKTSEAQKRSTLNSAPSLSITLMLDIPLPGLRAAQHVETRPIRVGALDALATLKSLEDAVSRAERGSS